VDEAFSTNLAGHARATASSFRGNDDQYTAARVTDGDMATYWCTDDDITAGRIEIDLGQTHTVKYVLLKEYIRLGQRVKQFNVEAFINNEWQKVAEATTIGYKRILKLDKDVVTDKVRVNIVSSKACPLISEIMVY
jgi:alpha-L-fucosidase